MKFPVVALLITAWLAGCSGDNPTPTLEGATLPEGDDPGYTAKQAAQIATEYAQTWREGAVLVGLEAQEIPEGSTGRPTPPGTPRTPDPVPGNGKAPYWLAGLRAPNQQFLLVAVTDEVKEIPGGSDHSLATAFTQLAGWKLDSDDAMGQLWYHATPGGATYALLRMKGAGNESTPQWTLQAGEPKITLILDAVTGETVAKEGTSQVQSGRAAFAVFIHGERLNFNDARYNFESTQFYNAYLDTSQPNGGSIIHLNADNVNVAEFLGSFGISFQPRTLQLDEGHGGAYHEDNNDTYARLYVDTGSGFDRVEHGPTHVLADGHRVLLTYGDYDALTLDEIKRQQDSVAHP